MTTIFTPVKTQVDEIDQIETPSTYNRRVLNKMNTHTHVKEKRNYLSK